MLRVFFSKFVTRVEMIIYNFAEKLSANGAFSRFKITKRQLVKHFGRPKKMRRLLISRGLRGVIFIDSTTS